MLSVEWGRMKTIAEATLTATHLLCQYSRPTMEVVKFKARIIRWAVDRSFVVVRIPERALADHWSDFKMRSAKFAVNERTLGAMLA